MTASPSRVTNDVPLRAVNLSAFYGTHRAIVDIDLDFKARSVTALIGPSGCGKTTLLRCLNRIHELTPKARVTGRVELDGEDVYHSEITPIELRHRVGMVFQRPNPFPTLSILDNTIAALPRKMPQKQKREIAEQSLTAAALWNEVKDKLKRSPFELSGGQQQRLCIARALAVEPEVLLMDEPTSSLDPISTSMIEDLVEQLTQKYTIVIVTHNMQQAARISDFTAFMLGGASGGELIEYDETAKLFFNPKDRRTEDYITGRFG